MFVANEIRRMLDDAGVQLRAMILLGVNCGFGNQDCATLPLKAVNLDAGWITYARPKTGIRRRCPLWPETVTAIRQALAERRTPSKHRSTGLVFITARGDTWAKTAADNPISKETVKLLRKLGLHRPRHSFYALRHVFATIAGETTDQVAVDHIMGHARDDMASVYRERISDERLKAVTDFVRRWLFGQDVGPGAVDIGNLEGTEQAAESTPLETPPAKRAAKTRRRTKAK